MISSIINRYCNALLSVLTMIYSPIYPIIPIRTFREKDKSLLKQRVKSLSVIRNILAIISN